ncbi:MAG: ATP synthase subunit I [Halioglobus sp.]|nr:ATP synthase subunit I [Halioglobus sp.]
MRARIEEEPRDSFDQGENGEALMNSAGITRPPVYRITLVQLVLLAVFGLGVLAFDPVAAYSVVCGGMIAIVPQAYFAALAFRWQGARAASAIARSSYAGEVGKFLLSIAGFALVFAVVRPLNSPAVFTGYLVMLVTQITGSWLLLTRHQRN